MSGRPRAAGGEEFTELVDPDFPIVSLVGKGANGLPFLIAKAAEITPEVVGAVADRSVAAKDESKEREMARARAGVRRSPSERALRVYGSNGGPQVGYVPTSRIAKSRRALVNKAGDDDPALAIFDRKGRAFGYAPRSAIVQDPGDLTVTEPSLEDYVPTRDQDLGASNPASAIDSPVAKKKSDPPVPVYNEARQLLGTVDPDAINELGVVPSDEAAGGSWPQPVEADPSMTPAPAAAVGTPAAASPSPAAEVEKAARDLHRCGRAATLAEARVLAGAQVRVAKAEARAEHGPDGKLTKMGQATVEVVRLHAAREAADQLRRMRARLTR